MVAAWRLQAICNRFGKQSNTEGAVLEVVCPRESQTGKGTDLLEASSIVGLTASPMQ